MKHYYFLGTACAFMFGAQTMAINPPSIACELTDGDTYIIMNYVRPTMYGTRTSWDGAYYLMGYDAWKANTGAWQPIDFTAHKMDDGTWTFTYEKSSGEGEEEVTSTYYLGIPASSGNLKALENKEVKWNITAGDHEGYYKMSPGQDNPNESVVGHPLHLNASGEYAIIYYNGNGFGFDIYGGIQRNEYDDPIYEDDTEEFPVFNNYDHTNWAFVHTEDIEAYNAKANVYVQIKDIEDNYADIDGFEPGFTALVAAAGELYDAGQLDEAVALVKAGRELYDAIIDAENRNETGDAALQTAIDKATDTFNGTADLTALVNAREALENALKIYLSGEGDFTSFGKNMSFEDLGNQGGKASSGIVDAPVGWNLYLNGKLSNTADEIKDGGVFNWCAINADATGAKDGDYAFGIWTSSVPEVELSQTIEGLENGTYLVSAALMVGANNRGSRMTTQRIFGNLNSALFGYEDDYNAEHLNPAEVYEYACLNEPVTDTELQEMSVSAYVYDGTLTFGLRTNGDWQAVASRTGGNSAGGDGWFKVDNFRIQYMGYDESDAANILDYFQKLLSEYLYEAMYTGVYDEATRLASVTPSGEKETNEAILACRDYIGTVKASVDAYKSMMDYLEGCWENITLYVDYADIDNYEAAVIAAEKQVNDGALDNDGLQALRESLDQALQQLLLSGVKVGEDVSTLIANPSFEDLTAQNGGNSSGITAAPAGWNLYLNGELCQTASEIKAQGVTNWCAVNKGDDISGLGLTDEEGNLISGQPTDGEHLFGIWSDNMPEVELSQTITDLPKGTYTLTADVMVQWDWAGDNMTTQRIFANDAVCMYGLPEYYVKNATADMLVAMEADRVAGFHIWADDYVEEITPDDEEEEYDAPAAIADDDDEAVDAYRLLQYANIGYGDGVKDASALLYTLTARFVVTDDGVAKIGFRSGNINRDGVQNAHKGSGWFKVDNFTLYYESENIPTAITCTQPSATVARPEFYTIGGLRLGAPQRGVNIVRQGAGTYKLLVK